MASSDEVRVVLEEECKHKHSDMHSVIIGIGCHNNLLITEVIHIIFHAKSIEKEVQFLIFCNFLAFFLIAVQWLTTKREYCLGLCITSLGNGSARRVSLGDEYACVLGKFLFCCRKLIVVMKLAVTELAVVYICSLISFLGLLLDA